MISLPLLLASLYLRGLEGRPWGPPVRSWGVVESAWRREEGRAGFLGRAGLWCEETCLNSPGLVAQAEALLASGRVVTSACPAYPARWRTVLKSAAPPAVWSVGKPFLGEPSISVAGSRRLSRPAEAFASGIGAAAARLGLAVVSGGAAGADRLSVRSAISLGAPCLEVWPCGLESQDFQSRPSVASQGWVLSVAAPQERFSTALAMERNILLYAASPLAVVVDCRLKQGGSWHGAVGALRRKLCCLAVRESPSSPGLSALCALGASPLAHPDLLGEAVEQALSHPAWAQGSLFGAA